MNLPALVLKSGHEDLGSDGGPHVPLSDDAVAHEERSGLEFVYSGLDFIRRSTRALIGPLLQLVGDVMLTTPCASLSIWKPSRRGWLAQLKNASAAARWAGTGEFQRVDRRRERQTRAGRHRVQDSSTNSLSCVRAADRLRWTAGQISS